MIESQDFQHRYGPWAMVTGASSGIGEQFAVLLAERGLNLILVARREDRLRALQARLQGEHKVDVDLVVADLSEPPAVADVLRALASRPVGLLVSNAGFGLKGNFAEHDAERLQRMVQVNAVTPMQLAHAVLPSLQARGHGGILFTGSIEGEVGFPYSTAYAASKAFVHSLGGGLWEECRASGVDVLVLSPGSTDTEAPALQGINRDQMVGMMPPSEVASQALDALGKRPLLIPGLMNRVFIALLRWLPRSWALRFAGFGMLSAIRNSQKA